jgi:hypothetical protein
MSPLVQCHGCARHIRAHEAQCPFCSTVTRARPPSNTSAASALFVAAMGVVSAGCSVLCEAVSVPGVCAERRPPNVGGPVSRSHDAPVPVYGGPPAQTDFGTMAAAYGAAPPQPLVASDAGVAPSPRYQRPHVTRYGGPRWRNQESELLRPPFK